MSEEEKCIMSMFTSSKSEARKLAKGDEVLMEYEKETEELEITDELFEAYDHELENYNRGVDEGFEKGIEQGKYEIIKYMINKGKSVQSIVEETGIPLEIIKKITDNQESLS